MSRAPFYLLNHRAGHLLGASPCEDAIMYDGLTCAFSNNPMGHNTEQTNNKYGITRFAQDEFCVESYKRASLAWERGFFKSEVTSFEVKGKKGTVLFEEDEEYKKVIFDKIPNLKPTFAKDGTITAANSSSINDGACALVLMSAEKAKELGVKPLARIVAYGDGATDPIHFGEAPKMAIEQCLGRAGVCGSS